MDRSRWQRASGMERESELTFSGDGTVRGLGVPRLGRAYL